MKSLLYLVCFTLVYQAAAQERVNVDRLLEDVAFLASDSLEGRLVDTDGNRLARSFIERRFIDLELSSFPGGFVWPFTFTDRGDSLSRVGANVVGYVRGRVDPDSFLVVTAHFDHVGAPGSVIHNGADDNASGTAVLLAAAAHFASHPPRHSIAFVAFDAEEQGLKGSHAFMANPPIPAARMRLNVNLDMVSRSDKGELYASGTYHYPWLRPFIERAAAGSMIMLRFGHDSPELEPRHDWTRLSDHYPFHQAGIPFVYFGVEDHPDYHQPTDDVGRIEPSFFGAAARLIIRSIEVFDREM